jgi:hypothetical protein
MNILVRPGANFLPPFPTHSDTETTRRSQNIVIVTNNTQFPDTVTKPKRTAASDPPPGCLIRQCSPTCYDFEK